jgi:hypothetical protein
MKRKIRTYEDLEREEQLLEELLRSQKELIQIEVGLLKQQLKPAKMALQFVGKITTRDMHNPLITQGASTVIDMLLKKFLLAKSGWVTKMLVPFFVKNYSSHLIADNKDTIVNKVASVFSNKNGRGKPPSTTPRKEN